MSDFAIIGLEEERVIFDLEEVSETPKEDPKPPRMLNHPCSLIGKGLAADETSFFEFD